VNPPAPYDYDREDPNEWADDELKRWFIYVVLALCVVILGLLLVLMFNGDGMH
jgi:hypothetical protein